VTQQILIGHSLGGSFLLKYVSEEKIGKTIAGIFLIATPYWGGAGWQYEGYERVALPEALLRNYRVERHYSFTAATTKLCHLHTWLCMRKTPAGV
jgi:hypothetical protein